MIDSIVGNRNVRRGVYILIGTLTLIMLVFAVIIEPWILYTTKQVSAYGSIEANEKGWPREDQRGAFILLNDNHNPIYAGNVLALLATTEAGVVSTQEGAHLLSGEIKSILIQSAVLNNPDDYRIYRLDNPVTEPLKYDRQPGGKVMLITPQSGQWPPGAYQVDIPAEGMFGGRTFYQFFVDPEK